jgi:hypothetical protein
MGGYNSVENEVNEQCRKRLNKICVEMNQLVIS